MKHSDVFGLYIMSPCCLSARAAGSLNPENEKALEAVNTPEDSAKLPFLLRAQLASAAAWSPDPKNPPLYLDLPMKDGKVEPDVLAKWAANAPLAFADQYIRALRQYRAIAIDVGEQDGLRIDAGKLHDVLDKYGIANRFEVIKAPTKVRWLIVFRITRFPSSVRIFVFRRAADDGGNLLRNRTCFLLSANGRVDRTAAREGFRNQRFDPGHSGAGRRHVPSAASCPVSL